MLMVYRSGMDLSARRYKLGYGFTIVELLIVIVVIAILAAITIVAYNGIQTRAENTATINGVAAYAKALSLYAVDNGQYPSTTVYPCLGSPTSNTCAKISGTGGCNFAGGTSVNATFDADIAQYLGNSKPTISNQTMTCTNGEVYRGAYANKNDTNPKTLYFTIFLKSTTCPSNFGPAKLLSESQSGQVTNCYAAMPAL